MSGGVVLGLGGTVDYEVSWDGSVLESLVQGYGIEPDEISKDVMIRDERSLVCSILGFLQAGAGGERFVASLEALESFSARFPREVTLGGTSVRAALTMHTVGIPSTVHLVSINDHVRRLLPDGVAYVSSAKRDSLEPHLIVQFPEGASVRVGRQVVRAPHPNRLIYVNDPPNRELVLSPALGDLFRKARLVLLSGLNTVQDEMVMVDRLATLSHHLDALSSDTVTVFEDAGYHVPAMTAHVRSAFAHRVDAWSLNEDEMQAYVGRPVDLLDPADLVAGLAVLRHVVPAGLLIVHTKHWALAYGTGAARWRGVLASGIRMASARYLHGDAMAAANVEAVRTEPVNTAGQALATAVERRLGADVAVVPAFSLSTATPTTIGLGDSFVGGMLAELAQRPVHKQTNVGAEEMT